ncbi:MAG: riboflavin synthase [Fusobacteriaceae bacterium]|nr:riboflavin synthase [Fusobacteriaceae bacterium]
MFTGLVEEIGRVLSLRNDTTSLKIKIKSNSVVKESKIGDSIATNGVCLTAIETGGDYFVADCMHETVKRTNLRLLKAGDPVNLEKSLTLISPLGGHLVTGDVDCVGIVRAVTRDGIAKIYEIQTEKKYMKYIVEKGRVAVDGASLTVMGLTDDSFSVSLIPHTQNRIVLGEKRVGDAVNVETDLIGKFVEKLLLSRGDATDGETATGGVTLDFLMKNGF